MTPRTSLRLRLLLAGAAAVLVALGLAGLGLAVLFERHVERRALAELSLHLDQVIAGLDRAADGALIQARPPADPRFAHPLSGLYWQLESGGRRLRSRSLWDTDLSLPRDDLQDGQVHEHRLAGPGGVDLLVLERSVTLPRRLGAARARAAVAMDRADIRAATVAFSADMLPFLGVLAVALIGAMTAQTRVGLRPLAAVRARLGAIRAGTATRLGTDVPDEVRALAAEVDALLAAREADVVRARARAGDLAHGLKTPLQVLTGDVDRLRAAGQDALADEVAEVAAAMRRHVDRELARARLARSHWGDATARIDARARPARVVRGLLAVLRRTPAGARLTWHEDLPEDLAARLDPDDCTEALGNLLDNAARHAVAAVTVTARRDGAWVEISVRDDGPGIPPGRLSEVLRRGARLDSAGVGRGLGLAIVQDIAEAWDGTLDLENADPGLRARLRVPAAAPAADVVPPSLSATA
ncbi:sensor histidine kinase [Roseospira visakhapatnamensis]|uniref:histidine kinase n=1 Tax=Roseospira visakhapatnamensis TaxID=390880 RepID=A0A7W6W9X8_9PROT|nr:HAMP domain-containing sensor histidine kinase [Roseospira visakhapatnamensis]MBB4265896.1 signal transduction histidine kinase [Roseospira visakhapatnamensis]